MRWSLAAGAACISLALASATACSDRPTAAIPLDSLSAQVIVSAPSVAAGVSNLLADSGLRAAVTSATPAVYVSMSPGAVPAGVTATIRNSANGQYLTTVMMNGGFDPVSIPASADDDVTVDIHSAAGLLRTSSVIVPKRRPPKIVRTDPPSGKTDVPLNNSISVVFSEPIDPATAATSVQLRRGDVAISGVLTLDPSGVFAEFTPGSPLAPNTSYDLVITTGVKNLSGDALEAEVRVPFTTAASETTLPLGGGTLYVAQDGRGNNSMDGGFPISQHGVLVYTGHPNPSSTIAGDNTGLSTIGPSGIAVDPAGRVYVAQSQGMNSILTYAPGATGNAAPVDVISGSKTGLSYPQGVALDAAGRLYVTNIIPYPANVPSITVYAPGASGNASPVATIQGSNTGLGTPQDIAVDAQGRVYVANGGGGSVTVYAPGANGNVSPIASISGSNTGLTEPIGIAVDGTGKIYVSNFLACGYDIASQGIQVFAAGANGNATPIASIKGSNTGLDGAYGLAVDAAGRLYVANATACSAMMSIPSPPSLGGITVYAPGATGNVPPIARIAGSSTGLFGPMRIAFSP